MGGEREVTGFQRRERKFFVSDDFDYQIENFLSLIG